MRAIHAWKRKVTHAAFKELTGKTVCWLFILQKAKYLWCGYKYYRTRNYRRKLISPEVFIKPNRKVLQFNYLYNVTWNAI